MIAQTEHQGHEPTGHLTPVPLPGPPDQPWASLRIEDVLAKINGPYMVGLQHCYKIGLMRDNALSGKVLVSFTVEEHGRVTDPEAAGVTPEVDECIKGQMARWHFGIPKDKDGDPTEASFAITLQLVPD